MAEAGPRLSVRNVSKTFGAQRVLSQFDLDIAPGEIHAVVGHNGSGKSTLVKLLAGYHRPDPGSHAGVDGQPFELGSARAAESAGLRFVHQDLGLVETLDTVDNLFLGGQFPTRAPGRIDWGAARRRATEVLGSLGFDFDPSLPVRLLSPTQKTVVAIARAIRPRDVRSRVVVLDEPTAALAARDVRTLFDVVRALQRQELAILYISHHLEEVFALADRVTVLRDGVRVATVPTNELDEPRLVELMVGKELAAASRTRRGDSEECEPVLRIRELVGNTLAGVSFSVKPGEVVGVAGVDGSGREELARALFGGVDRGGEVTVDGQPLPSLRPDIAVQRRVAFVPADRTGDAALSRMSVADNLVVASMRTRIRGFWLDKRAAHAEAKEWVWRLAIRPPRHDAALETLSGGNQQKVILGRWLRMSPRVLLLDEPTKGIDVSSVARIWELVDDAAQVGTAVVACSSDTVELVSHCDRVLVLRRGRLAAIVEGDALDASRVDALALADASAEATVA